MRECQRCHALFVLKKGGHNARYCTDTCKRNAQRARRLIDNPEQLRAARQRSWTAIKTRPERLAVHRRCSLVSRRRVRDWLSAYKLEKGCADCGYKKHASALQLDHEGRKRIAIADARSSIARLQREIKEGTCVVRCANCHSIRTWERKQKNENISQAPLAHFSVGVQTNVDNTAERTTA